MEERIHALLLGGLWSEAFAVAHSAPNAGKTPIITLCEAIETDLQGNKDDARTKYEAVIEQRPTNRLALARLNRLGAGGA